jgi:uncharacterized membrane protein
VDTWTELAACADAKPGDELAHVQVQYCLAWDLWLCDADRLRRGNANLNAIPAPPRRVLPLEGILQL